MVWQLGDGNRLNFWMDKWLPNGCSFMMHDTNDMIDTTISVKNALTNNGQWDLNFFNIHLTPTL